MTRKEQLPSDEELSRLALVLARRFVQRYDIYPQQLPAGLYVKVDGLLNAGLLMAHLKGEVTLGTYLLNPRSQGRFLVLDADEEEGWEQLWELARKMEKQGVLSYMEASRRGGHQWFFFAGYRPGADVRSFARGLLATHEIEAEIEVYPKQDRLRTGPGSLIRLPFGVHQKSGKRYGFYLPSGAALGETIREQIWALGQPHTVPEKVFKEYMACDMERGRRVSLEASGGLLSQVAEDAPVSERIKASMTVRDFINHYAPEVRLSERGNGYCPFHDDNHRSFGVHDEGNFWHCFAGCGGGSIIDFWMKMREKRGEDSSFAATVKELAIMLL
jgi:hypothetical protein